MPALGEAPRSGNCNGVVRAETLNPLCARDDMSGPEPSRTKPASATLLTALPLGRTPGVRLSTGAIVAMSVVGVVTSVVAGLLALMVQAPQSPFIATQRPAVIAASSI